MSKLEPPVRCVALKTPSHKWALARAVQCKLMTSDLSGLCYMHRKHPPKRLTK